MSEAHYTNRAMSEEHYTNREWLMVQDHAKKVAALKAENQRLREALVEIATWVNLTDTFEIATKALEAGQ